MAKSWKSGNCSPCLKLTLKKRDCFWLPRGQVWARCSSSSPPSGANDRPLFTYSSLLPPPPFSVQLVLPCDISIFAHATNMRKHVEKDHDSRASGANDRPLLTHSPLPPPPYSAHHFFPYNILIFAHAPNVNSVLLFQLAWGSILISRSWFKSIGADDCMLFMYSPPPSPPQPISSFPGLYFLLYRSHLNDTFLHSIRTSNICLICSTQHNRQLPF